MRSQLSKTSALLALNILLLATAPRAQGTFSQAPVRPAATPTQLASTLPWVATVGGPDAEIPATAVQAKNGTFQVCGQTIPSGGLADGWVVRLSPRGVVRWQLELGGPGRDVFQAMLATPDGGSLVAGFTYSFGAGGQDAWLVKLRSTGAVEWQKTYGGPGDELFQALSESPNGYYVGGSRNTGVAGNDVWLLEIDPLGNVLWQETIGGNRDDLLRSLTTTPDGLAFVANSNSDFVKPAVPFARPWLVKMDGQGSVLWQKTYNFSGGDEWNHLIALEDGGFVATGEILAYAFFRGDVWVVRLNAQGDVVWDRRMGDNFGNNWVDSGVEVRETPDGGFLVAAASATITPPLEDIWLIKLSSEGAFQWDETYGWPSADLPNAMFPAKGGGYLLAGFSWGSTDALVMRLSASGGAGSGCALSGPTAPNVWTSSLTVGVPAVSPVPTSVVPADSAASASASPSTGGYVCSPP